MSGHSQNGYAVDAALIAKYTVPGTAVKLNLRKGDSSVVLLHFAAWWNKHVSPLKQAQCGGYNDRNIAGTGVKSNHASGTAIDLNWSEFPEGRVRTTAAQRSAIRAQLKYYGGVLRWGGDYSDVDEMHTEINKAPAAVTAVADKIRKDAQPMRTATTQSITVQVPLLKQGDNDAQLTGYDTIVRMQRIVGAADDGAWGPKTTAKIAAFCRVPTKEAATLSEKIYRLVFGAPAK
jgi:hypothetical protein